MKFMIYGANGYTGELCIRESIKQGLKDQLVIAGRSTKLQNIAKKYNLKTEQISIFSLDDKQAISKALKEVALVLHCAGPFIETYKPMVEACIENGVHYLDITGEIDVFEAIHKMDKKAKDKNIFLVPGVGFDIVPTDCLAAQLKDKMPDATELELAFNSIGGPSGGTTKTGLLNIFKGTPNRARRNGKLSTISQNYGKEIIMDGKPIHCNAIAWGDVYTAFVTTEIPNITVYMKSFGNPTIIKILLTTLYWMGWIPFFTFFFMKLIEWLVKGPNEEVLQKTTTTVWGRVKNEKGEEITGTFTTCNAYKLTANASILAVKKILNRQTSKDAIGGYYTPSLLFGKGFIQECNDVTKTEFKS